MKFLRIFFTILCALCLGAVVPLGLAFSWVGVLAALLFAAIFFGLMLLCKRAHEKQESNTILPLSADEVPAENTTGENDAPSSETHTK